MPRGRKANAGASLDALKERLKAQYEENVKMIEELSGKDAGDDSETVKKAIKLIRTPNIDIEEDVLPYIKVAVDKMRKKGRIGTKKPKPAPAAEAGR